MESVIVGEADVYTWQLHFLLFVILLFWSSTFQCFISSGSFLGFQICHKQMSSIFSLTPPITHRIHIHVKQQNHGPKSLKFSLCKIWFQCHLLTLSSFGEFVDSYLDPTIAFPKSRTQCTCILEREIYMLARRRTHHLIITASIQIGFRI